MGYETYEKPLDDLTQQLSRQTGIPVEEVPEGQTADTNSAIATAESLAFSDRDMQRNLSYSDIVKPKTRTMTKSQLRKYKIEKEGFMDPTGKSRMDSLENKLDQLLGIVTTVLEGKVDPGSPVSSTSQVPQGPVASDHQESLDVVETTHGQPDKVEIRPPSPSQTVVTVSSDSTPTVSVGSSPTDKPLETITEETDPTDDWSSLMENPEDTQEPETETDPKIERAVQLTSNVVKFLGTHDPHKRFRQFLPKIHRMMGYSGWSKEMQKEFDFRFKSLLSNGVFITNICRQIQDMQSGKAIGEKAASSLVVATAGFMCFGLMGTTGS